jgi:hypothetical protein
MDDTTFFREQAERCRSQASTTADPTVQSTLASLSTGFAAYADGLEQQVVESQITDVSQPPDAIANEATIAPDETIIAGPETPIDLSNENSVTDQDWSAESHAESDSDSKGVTEKYVFFAMLLAPSLGMLAWTILKHGTW